MDPMEGLKPGRMVYFVFDVESANEVNRRRTTSLSIAERLAQDEWPRGAQAHVGNMVNAGDICPAVVVKVGPVPTSAPGSINLQVFLDGSDTFWAMSVRYSEEKRHRSWHWMFEGQNTRYQPDRVEKSNATS